MFNYKRLSTNFLIQIIIVGITFSGLLAIDTKEWAVAINLSGRQRMLSQKMAKEFLLTKLDIDKNKNKQLLTKTMKMFERTLDQLITGDKDLFIPPAPNQEILKQLNKVKTLWVDYKKALENKDLLKVAALNLPVLKNMHKAVGMYENASIKAGIKGSGTVINVAGRQRMLTQKMSKEIFLIALEVDANNNLSNLKKTKELFNKSLEGLINGDKKINLPPTTDKRNLKQMAVVKKLWIPFKENVNKVISTSKANKAVLQNIYKKNPVLLKQMNKAVQLYEVSAK